MQTKKFGIATYTGKSFLKRLGIKKERFESVYYDKYNKVLHLTTTKRTFLGVFSYYENKIVRIFPKQELETELCMVFDDVSMSFGVFNDWNIKLFKEMID
jgi:hypothetical protein